MVPVVKASKKPAHSSAENGAAADVPLLTYSQHTALYEQAKHRGLEEAMEGLGNNSSTWLHLPTELATGGPSEMSHHRLQHDASSSSGVQQGAVGARKTSPGPQRKTTSRGGGTVTKTTAGLPPKPPAPIEFCVPIDDGDSSCRYWSSVLILPMLATNTYLTPSSIVELFEEIDKQNP